MKLLYMNSKIFLVSPFSLWSPEILSLGHSEIKHSLHISMISKQFLKFCLHCQNSSVIFVMFNLYLISEFVLRSGIEKHFISILSAASNFSISSGFRNAHL